MTGTTRLVPPLALLALLTSFLMAQSPTLPDEIVCPRVEQAPVMDGGLDDPCWLEVPAVDSFTRPLSNAAPAKAVSLKTCLAGDALYLAFDCAEPHPERIKARARDGSPDVWRDDCVEIWIRTGESQVDFDQFIANAAGARQTVRRRRGAARGDWEPEWSVKTRVGSGSWTAEIRIPLAALGLSGARPGAMVQVKFGREDYAGGAEDLATWPPRSPYAGIEGYGKLYFESRNLLANADMSETKDGRIAAWGFGEDDQALFAPVADGAHAAIRFLAPGRYSVAQQSLRLLPNRVYRLEAWARGTAAAYLRARTSAREGEPSTPYTVHTKPGADYQPLELRFPSGESGRALIIVGNTEGLGRGDVFIRSLSVSQDVAYDADGPAIALPAGRAVVVKKVPVTDCRALRGFVVAPVDGRLNSLNWNMDTWEYGMRGAGAGVGYRYRNNDGLHITLADEVGVDAVLIRKGARVKLYRDAERYDDPGEAPLVWVFRGRAKTSRAVFPERLRSRRFSFFELEDGLVADVSFFRVETAPPPCERRVAFTAGAAVPLGDLARFAEKRFSRSGAEAFRLGDGEATAIRLKPKRAVHLVSEPLAEPAGLTAVALRLSSASAPEGCALTVAVQDPLNPRQELMGVDFDVGGTGELRPVLDVPDQVLRQGDRLWVTLTSRSPVTFESVTCELLLVSPGVAAPEALACRKLTMKGLFCILSEARPWNGFRTRMDLEAWYGKNRWGEGVRELAETIAQCRELGPDDDTVRCYDEWFWRRHRKPPPFEPRIDDVPGAPRWAVLARQAWLTSREVAKWWIDNRLVPTGEFGGLVGDDSDMYQNYADFPMLETDGVAAGIKHAAAALAELAEEENLEQGLNRRTMDPLHAYEEGVNQEALMLWWFYGDPIYFERCLLAAKSMPALTVVTPKGHRHFKNQDCGAEDLRTERELGVDGHAHPLMLHPCFEIAWYNGSPKVLAFLEEWGKGWVEHQLPDAYATSVNVATEEATAKGDRPLYGGYGGQSSAHVFLYWLTDDLSYIRPFMDFFTKGTARWPSGKHVPELWQRGALAGVANPDGVLREHAVTRAIALGEKQALCEALTADIAELQRFRTMYTDAEVFTDRVFLNGITNAALCYTGGYATRNKYNHTHAASWEGLGTDFAALVLAGRRDRFKCLVYNFRDRQNTGRLRLWTLEHGRYRLRTGPDRDGDDAADSFEREEVVEVARATVVPISLPPGGVTVVEFEQLERLDDIRQRPDLAIAAREISVSDGVLSGVVHNIGATPAASYVVALADAEGVLRARKTFGPLAAPADLEPKRRPFRFDALPADVKAWSVRVDPDDAVAEIFEGNNRCDL